MAPVVRLCAEREYVRDKRECVRECVWRTIRWKCWWEMPAEREAEICEKALELLSGLCSRGEVQDDNCLDFIYYFRDLSRPRHADTGQAPQSPTDFSLWKNL